MEYWTIYFTETIGYLIVLCGCVNVCIVWWTYPLIFSWTLLIRPCAVLVKPIKFQKLIKSISLFAPKRISNRCLATTVRNCPGIRICTNYSSCQRIPARAAAAVQSAAATTSAIAVQPAGPKPGKNTAGYFPLLVYVFTAAAVNAYPW